MTEKPLVVPSYIENYSHLTNEINTQKKKTEEKLVAMEVSEHLARAEHVQSSCNQAEPLWRKMQELTK